MTDNPGSPEAVAAGCICPVIDNHYGAGRPGKSGPYFYERRDCLVHGRPARPAVASSTGAVTGGNHA